MRARFGVDELRVDPHPVLVALHRAFEHIANAKLLADLLGVDMLALVSKSGVAGDDETVADAREFGGEVFGDPVGEIVLRWIAREIGEGQHDDGKMRGLAGRARRRSGRTSTSAPTAARRRSGDRGGERRELQRFAARAASSRLGLRLCGLADF